MTTKSSSSSSLNILNDLKILAFYKEFSHNQNDTKTNILKLLNVKIDLPKQIKFTFEHYHYNLGDFFKLSLRHLNDPLPISKLSKITIQMVEGVNYLHSKLIVHKNLSLEKFCVIEGDDLYLEVKAVKLGDFSQMVRTNLRFRSHLDIADDGSGTALTREHIPIETLLGYKLVTINYDLWMLGICFLQIFEIFKEFFKKEAENNDPYPCLPSNSIPLEFQDDESKSLDDHCSSNFDDVPSILSPADSEIHQIMKITQNLGKIRVQKLVHISYDERISPDLYPFYDFERYFFGVVRFGIFWCDFLIIP